MKPEGNQSGSVIRFSLGLKTTGAEVGNEEMGRVRVGFRLRCSSTGLRTNIDALLRAPFSESTRRFCCIAE